MPSGQLARRQGGSARRRRVEERKSCICQRRFAKIGWRSSLNLKKRREATLLELKAVNASRATL